MKTTRSLRRRLRLSILRRFMSWFLSDSYKADSVSPSLILDFANNRYAANSSAKNFSDILTFSRSTTATYFDANGVMQTAAVDTPRFDYDPSTGTALGLLIEESRTNYVTNNTSVSAVSGVIGSGGSLPSGWGHNLRGLSLQITRDVDPRGIPSVRLRFSGIPSSTGSVYVTFNSNNTTTTLNGDSWTNSFYARLVSGDWTNTTSQQTSVNVFSSGLSWLQTICISSVVGLSSVLTRYTVTGTVSNASAAYVQPLFQMNVTSGLAVDVEFDIGGIQIEKAPFASSLILTSAGAVTRSADSVVNTGSNTVPFSSWYNSAGGTMYADYNCSNDGSTCGVASISDNTSSNRFLIRSTAGQSAGVIVSGGTIYYNLTGFYVEPTNTKQAFAAKLNDAIQCSNANLSPADNTVTMPISPTRLIIGAGETIGATIFTGWIKEFRYYNQRITNSELQRITT